jgi:UPF0755 protein
MRRRIAGGIILILALAVVGGAGLVAKNLLFGSPAKRLGPAVTVTIPAGASCSSIGDRLESAGIIGSSTHWELDVCLGSGGNLHPGTYSIRQNESYSKIVALLSAGPPPVPVVRLTIPEGYAERDIAAQAAPRVGISAAVYRAAVRAAHPPAGFKASGSERLGMEGFLFPDTYDLRKPASATQLVNEQLTAFLREDGLVDERAAARKHLTRYDVLIIASMIEREAGYPGDRAKIAAVIYNRLHLNMPLGIDATTQYAIGSWRQLTAKDLALGGPYNTRTHKGLPPTPICNPGLASLQAAAHPAKVPYLYYVAIPHDPKRRSFFTASYQAFLHFQQTHPA